MKPLEKQFTGTGEVKGFNFTQIRCTNRAFLYEVNTKDSVYYEVFKKVKNKRFDCISYPSANYFGVWAFTYPSLKEAENKFNQLNKVKND